jgi:hypothetical protein
MHFGRSMDIEGEMESARIKLDPQTIDAIARRVVALLERRDLSGGAELVDAAELARRLGIERSWVYTHAIELGPVKLGRGAQAAAPLRSGDRREGAAEGRWESGGRPARPLG